MQNSRLHNEFSIITRLRSIQTQKNCVLVGKLTIHNYRVIYKPKIHDYTYEKLF